MAANEAARGEILGEPGIEHAIAAPTVGEDDQGTPRSLRDRRILQNPNIDEKRKHKRLAHATALGGVEHCEGKGPIAVGE
jgi:hypothetical protein